MRRLCSALGVVFLIVTSAVSAAVNASATATEKLAEKPASYSSSEALLPMLMALGVIILTIYVIAWIAKKLNLTPHVNSHFKTITSVSLGGRERIIVVELSGKQYALGVTSNSINLLFELEDNIENPSFGLQDNKMLNKLTDLLNNEGKKVKKQ
jgi:flagellar biosynthetic protein FliO